MRRTVSVRLRDRSYDVLIGPGVRTSLAEVVQRLGAKRAVVVSARPEDWVPDTGVPKTAVNLPASKNLVGAFWQPSAVLCDTDHLSTLPRREMLNGLDEIARRHFIGATDLRGLPLAGALGRIGQARVDEHLAVVRHYGLPTALPVGVEPAVLTRHMRRDKKVSTGLAFVLDGPAGAELVRDVPQDVVIRVLDQMPREHLAELVAIPKTDAATT
ncbi:hypothetical protein [Streptomyces sp. NPDC059850]|uniref:hypothetical protein n=1 Tax=Streptomyces sp. NPDC059850 TaxID=3346970 RepID=UPI0036588D8B